MTYTGTATFQIRSFGRFRLNAKKLEYLGRVRPTDNEDLSRGLLGELFTYLDRGKNMTVHGAIDLLPEAFGVNETAVSNVEWADLTPVKSPDPDALY